MQWSRQVLLCIECRRVPEPVTCACSYTGVGLFTKMQTSFGSLTTGYGPSKHIFPLAFGETGSFYTAVSICFLCS